VRTIRHDPGTVAGARELHSSAIRGVLSITSSGRMTTWRLSGSAKRRPPGASYTADRRAESSSSMSRAEAENSFVKTCLALGAHRVRNSRGGFLVADDYGLAPTR
jgi:hypothetical protein